MSSKSLSMRLLQEISSEQRLDRGCAKTVTNELAAMLPKEFADRFMLVSALFPCNPSNKARPPSSISRFKRTLTLSNESLTLSARPKYLPPSACIWLSAKFRFVRMLLAPISFVNRRIPWFVILLCDKSKSVICALLVRPLISMRNKSSSTRFDCKTRVVKFLHACAHFAMQSASEIFMPNSIRSYCIPILFIPYVMLSLVRFGNLLQMLLMSGWVGSCCAFSVKI